MEREINVAVREQNEAPIGSLLIKKDDGKWYPVSFETLNSKNNARLLKLEKLPVKFNNLVKYNKKFVKYAKSHFLVVANHLLIRGLYDKEIDGEQVAQVIDDVIANKKDVQTAIKDLNIEKEFNELYGNENELEEYPEV